MFINKNSLKIIQFYKITKNYKGKKVFCIYLLTGIIKCQGLSLYFYDIWTKTNSEGSLILVKVHINLDYDYGLNILFLN